ncbi:transcriptional regulator, LuxR family [Mycolicibacterium rhodesiae JS60]|nr:transcriptional regulator, LuxR family [Mycolicibacterium rhodesiae JS60]
MSVRTEPVGELLVSARAAYRRGEWAASYRAFERANSVGALVVDDLDAMASAAWRIGYGKEAVRVAELVFTQLTRTDPNAAAMKAVELALAWLMRGHLAIGQGWASRARRLLAGSPESPAYGYLIYVESVVAVLGEDVGVLVDRAAELRTVADRADVPALTALSLVAQGMSALFEGRTAEAYGMFDEAMLPLLADQVPVEWAGEIYCIVLHYCHRIADLPQMRAWTRSMEQWCDGVDAATYGGVCDVHRLQILAASENYRLLEERLAAASRGLAEVNTWAGGEGYYQLGEVRRQRGDVDGAFQAFANARAYGIEPQPGEALLRCSLGDVETAWTELRLALVASDRFGRMRLLRAAVEIALARDDFDEAEQHCLELAAGAARFCTPGFQAWAAHARGLLLVRCGRYADALISLETALRQYRVQQSRYETAQIYEWMALAHRGLGADEVAIADEATAASIYRQLSVESAPTCGAPTTDELTKRETEIIKAIASGDTNKQVASALFISERTVARHLANIYAKLGVSSRTAAAAWAHEKFGPGLR